MALTSRMPPAVFPNDISIDIGHTERPTTPASALAYQQQQSLHATHPTSPPLIDSISDISEPTTAGSQMNQSSWSDRFLLGQDLKYNDKENDAQPSSSSTSSSSPSLSTPLPSGDDIQDRLQRHPSNIQGSRFYTRFFHLDRPETRSSVIVRSTWLPTSVLFFIRFISFLYASTVLLTDLFQTDRPQFEFCFLTQLSYLGLISYLGTVSWHTLSEWRRERALRGSLRDAQVESAGPSILTMPTTTIERQHWLLTDMNFFLYHTICTFHIIVPLLFWGYLTYEGDARSMALEMSPDSLWRNYSFHGGDLILMAIEITINAMPFIASHIIFVYVIGLLFLAEAHIVHYVDGFWIYPFLDTSVGPIWMALYIGVGFVIMCAFIFMFYLHKVKYWIRDKSQGREQLQQQQQQQQPQESQERVPGETMDVYQSYSHADAFRQMIESQNQNRKRSGSDGSNYSTTSTLVGDDDGMSKSMDKDRSLSRRTSRKLSFVGEQGPISPGMEKQQQLEIVEEGDETEREEEQVEPQRQPRRP